VKRVDFIVSKHSKYFKYLFLLSAGSASKYATYSSKVCGSCLFLKIPMVYLFLLYWNFNIKKGTSQ